MEHEHTIVALGDDFIWRCTECGKQVDAAEVDQRTGQHYTPQSTGQLTKRFL